MVVESIQLQGYTELITKLNELNEEVNKSSSTKSVILFFIGSKDQETDSSWCPDCVKADPIVNEALASSELDAVFITCDVGQRDLYVFTIALTSIK
jgi:thiol-disulfide isomerase/thioredoxin